MKIFNRCISLGLICILLLGSFSCSKKNIPTVIDEVEEYTYMDSIPGVTKEDIAAIETLRSQNKTFIYGMDLSTDSFITENGELGGFAPLFSDFLSRLLGLSFEVQIVEREELPSGLLVGKYDFTSALSVEEALGFHKTSVISERKIQQVFAEQSDASAHGLRTASEAVYGFLDSNKKIEDKIRPYLQEEYEAVYFSTYEEGVALLESGALDCIFDDGAIGASFLHDKKFVIEDFEPSIVKQMTFMTKQTELSPVIDVLQKYLESGGIFLLEDLRSEGNQLYLQELFLSMLTSEEREYLTIHQHPAAIIPIVSEHDNYPTSFFNETEAAWQGISIDLLHEIENMTGMTFGYINGKEDTWGVLKEMLETGVAVLATELIQTPEREGRFLWTESYQVSEYILLSDAQFPEVHYNQVGNCRVGYVEGTAHEETFWEIFPNHENSVGFESIWEAFEALENGEIDLLIGTRNMLLNLTNYLEIAGYKANLVLDKTYESAFGLHLDEKMLQSIINKAMSLIDTEEIVNEWTRRVFDYRGKLARAQVPYLGSVLVLLAVVLTLVTFMFLRHRSAGKQLEQTVLERTKELEIQTQKAKVASQTKSDFLARMSHEIRTPLNAIMGMTEIAKKTNTTPKTADSLNQISTASSHLLGILNDVLDMAKIESGKFIFSSEPFGFYKTMEEVVDIISQRCDDGQIKFVHEFGEISRKVVIGDKMRLKQVLINLLGNAVKFTPAGGTINFAIHTKEIEDNRLKADFSVADTGIGMTKEQSEKLFVAFEQADATISTRFGGTGLGLAISQHLIKQMDGEIKVDSEFGKGSNFYFTLLLEIANQEEQDKESNHIDETSFDFSNNRILLAEDVEINRMILIDLLEDTNIVIEEAADGEIAVNMFEATPEGYYDLIFMDIQMPNMNGYEATEKIRGLERRDAKTIPIYAMTANAYKEDVEHAKSVGMNGHLSKPINMVEVLKTLSNNVPRKK